MKIPEPTIGLALGSVACVPAVLVALLPAAAPPSEDQGFWPPQAGVQLGWHGESTHDPINRRPCWRDVVTGEVHDIDVTDLVERDGYWFQRTMPEPRRDTLTGTVLVRGYSVEWWAWKEASDGTPWNGPRWDEFPVIVPALILSADFDSNDVVDTRDFVAFLDAWSDQSQQ